MEENPLGLLIFVTTQPVFLPHLQETIIQGTYVSGKKQSGNRCSILTAAFELRDLKQITSPLWALIPLLTNRVKAKGDGDGRG